jgi:hypothetical protein
MQSAKTSQEKTCNRHAAMSEPTSGTETMARPTINSTSLANAPAASRFD